MKMRREGAMQEEKGVEQFNILLVFLTSEMEHLTLNLTLKQCFWRVCVCVM